MLCQRTVQRFGNAELELTRVSGWQIRLMDNKPLFQCCRQPCALRILCVPNDILHRFAAGQASRQVRVAANKAAFIRIRDDFQRIGQGHILFKRFHDDSPHFQQYCEPFDIYFLNGLMLRNGDWLAAGLAEGIVTTAAARGKHLVAVVSNTLRSSSNHKSFDKDKIRCNSFSHSDIKSSLPLLL